MTVYITWRQKKTLLREQLGEVRKKIVDGVRYYLQSSAYKCMEKVKQRNKYDKVETILIHKTYAYINTK